MSYEIYIPDELISLPQWVCVAAGSKVPLSPVTGLPASSSDPKSWGDFFTAIETVKDGLAEYVGFVFNGNGIIGIDIDNAFEDESLSHTAADILVECGDTFSERSKSGRGIHIYLKGKLPFTGRNNGSGVEIYSDRRFFVMTGNKISETDKINENQPAIDYIIDNYFQNFRQSDGKMSSKVYTPVWRRGDRIQIKPIYPAIPEGCRNTYLTSLAGTLKSAGYNLEQIYQELLECNEKACKPKLSKSEVYGVAESIEKYRK